jgi:hypothetical protein
VDFSFAEIRVRGRVTREDDPAPGFEVRAVEHNEELDILMQMGQATTGQDGTYEITLPKPGHYTFYLFASSPHSFPTSSHEVSVEEAGETTVDFSLEKATVRGKVVDEEGKPVEGAWVELRWNAVLHGTESGAGGAFELLLDDEGKGDVQARKRGYRDSELQEVTLEEESELPPLVVVLKKEKRFRGTLSAVNGLPVAGGWVGSLRNPYGDEAVRMNHERTGADGRFEVPPVEGRRNRLFASGPGCPLSAFDPIDENGELALHCQGRPAVLDVTLTDGEGRPVPNASLILRQGTTIIPRRLLALHLAFLGLRAETDAAGRLVVPNLAPGDYDVFVADPVTEGMIEAGSRTGYLATVHLSPLATTERRLTAAGRPQGAP